MTYIIDSAVGFPENYYPQEVLANALRKYCMIEALDFDLENIDRFFNNVLIKGRYFMLPLDTFFDPPSISKNMNDTIEATVSLVTETIQTLLGKVELNPEDISQLACTSLIPAVPGMDARLMNRIPFDKSLKRLPLAGVGCMGGAFGLSRVAEYLDGHPKDTSILAAAEPSSSLWQGSLQRDLSYMIRSLPDNPSVYSDIIMTIVTAALFGDGSAAVLMAGEEHPPSSISPD